MRRGTRGGAEAGGTSHATSGSARGRWLLTALALAAAAGCSRGGGGPTARTMGDTGALHGVALVVGAELGDWSLLAIPRDGGKATSRDVSDPTHVLWTGTTDLPASREVHVLEGPTVVLRTDQGGVYRYDPSIDSLEAVGHVGTGARWGAWSSYGSYVDSASGRVLEIGPEDSWEFRLSGRPSWASPVEDGGLAVLGAGSSRGTVWLVSRGDSAPSSRTAPGFGAPGLTTAWGKRVVLSALDRRSLKVLAVPSLTDAEDIGLGGAMSAVAASPSSHDIYAALSDPPRVVAVNRFTRDAKVLAGLDAAVTDLRPAVLGGFLLGRATSGIDWIPLAGGSSRRARGDWRGDLPLGTPAGLVLLSRGDTLLEWRPQADADPRPVDAPAGDWWAAVRWNPAPPPVRMTSVSGDTTGAADSALMEPPVVGGAPAPTDTGTTRMAGRPEGAATDSAASSGVAPVASAGGARPDSTRRGQGSELHPEPGIYAIVTSAQAESGVRKLLSGLSEAGYPTALQRYLDDAGQAWYRGMVGPFPSREEAEAAARQLRRERSLKVWVTEIRPGTLSPETSP